MDDNITYQEFKKLSEIEQKQYMVHRVGSLYEFQGHMYPEYMDEFFDNFTEQEKVEFLKSCSINTEELYGKYKIFSVDMPMIILFEHYSDLFLDEDKVKMAMVLGSVKVFKEYETLFTDEQKVLFIKSKCPDNVAIVRKYIDLFSDEDKVELIKKHDRILNSYGDLVSEYIELFSDEDKLDIIKRNPGERFDLFCKYIDLFSDEDKIEMINKYGSKRIDLYSKYIDIFPDKDKVWTAQYAKNGLKFFTDNIDNFTDEQKVKIILSHGYMALNLFRKYESLFSYSEVLEIHKKFNSAYFYIISNIKEGKLTEEEKVQLMKGLDIYGKNIFEECVDYFTDEQKAEIIMLFGKEGIELFKRYSHIFTDEQKAEIIMRFGEEGLELFKRYSHTFTDEQKADFITKLPINEASGLFNEYIACFTDKQKVEMISKVR